MTSKVLKWDVGLFLTSVHEDLCRIIRDVIPVRLQASFVDLLV